VRESLLKGVLIGRPNHPGSSRSFLGVDNRAEVREFLISRRAKLTPRQAGLSDVGNRRVPGLRRSEVAALAGLSVGYYAKLERAALAGASAAVLDAIARALQLDEAERAHLFHLAHAADGTSAIIRPRRRSTQRWTPRPSLQWVHRFYPDWDLAADTCVAILRTEAGRDPYDKGLHDLVGELSTRSEAFRRRWSAHNVRYHGAGTKCFHHHVVGNLELAYESVDMISEPGLTMTIYAAEPGSTTEHALALLASWAATQDIDTAAQPS
jgi:transcriptional regulator with XRE-family HTH domain